MILSFIIPVYKTPEQLLRNCLDSVLKYSRPMELICVLDSPGDPCEKVLDEYAAKEPRLRLLKNDRNRGVSYSRNRGMDAATGAYLAFVDADDEAFACAYEEAVALADEFGLDGCALAPGNESHQVRNGVSYGKHIIGAINDPKFGLGIVRAFCWAVYPAVLRRAYLQNSGQRFIEGRRYGEDFVFITRTLCAGGRFGFLNLNGYKSVGHEGSTCKAKNDVDNFVQGVNSSLDVLRTAVADHVAAPVLAWYLSRTLELSFMPRSIAVFIRGVDRRAYRRLLSEYFGIVSSDCAEVSTWPLKIVAAIIGRFPGLWFLPGAPGVMMLKVLNHFKYLSRVPIDL